MGATNDDRVVLCAVDVESDDSIVDALESVATVRTATSERAVLDALEDASCVVIGDSLADVGPIGLIEAVHGRDPDLPIVFHPGEGSEDLAIRATAAGATTYLPESEGTGALIERVREAIEAGERRRRRARNSTVLETIVEDLPVTMFVKDEEARILAMAEAPESWGRDEVIGKTDIDLYSDDDPVHARRAYEDDLEVIQTGEPIVEQEEKIDAEDYTAWVETTKVPWRVDGEIRGLVGISRDITERKEYEHELARERARSERFANYIAHDLRNPLNVARGYLELARETGETEPLDDVESSLDRIEEVIDDVLALVGQEDEEPPVTQTKLYEPIQSAWETVDTRSATLAIDAPAESLVVAERSHLQELFENLIRNAAEHGGDDVTIRVGLLEDGFYLEDDGVGIPEEERDSVLEYGYTRGEGGTGIGLAVVAELADVYDWEVDVTEGTGGGARFEFRECPLVAEPPGERPLGERIVLDRRTDVGDTSARGRTEREGDTWVLEGAGTDIWSDTNEFHFAHAAIEGDVRITARLEHLERVEEYTKAGVTIRNGLDEAAPLGYVGLTADHGSEVLWRSRKEDRTRYVTIDVEAEPPHWLRAERAGETVTLSISGDGDSWMPVDQRRIDLENPAYVGLAVCSHENGTLAEARFDGVDVYELE